MPGERLSEMGRQGKLQPPAHTLTPTRRNFLMPARATCLEGAFL